MYKYDIRKVTVDDAVGFMDVFNIVAIESGFLTRGPYDSQYQVGDITAYLSSCISKSDRYSISVLTFNNRIVGVVSVSPESESLSKLKHVSTLCIAIMEEARGLGFGKRMVELAINEARRLGYEKLTLEVMKSNKVACRLYEQCGFTIYGESKKAIKNHDNSYDDIILMDIFLS